MIGSLKNCDTLICVNDEGGEDATIHPQEKWSIFENLTLLLISV